MLTVHNICPFEFHLKSRVQLQSPVSTPPPVRSACVNIIIHRKNVCSATLSVQSGLAHQKPQHCPILTKLIVLIDTALRTKELRSQKTDSPAAHTHYTHTQQALQRRPVPRLLATRRPSKQAVAASFRNSRAPTSQPANLPCRRLPAPSRTRPNCRAPAATASASASALPLPH